MFSADQRSHLNYLLLAYPNGIVGCCISLEMWMSGCTAVPGLVVYCTWIFADKIAQLTLRLSKHFSYIFPGKNDMGWYYTGTSWILLTALYRNWTVEWTGGEFSEMVREVSIRDPKHWFGSYHRWVAVTDLFSHCPLVRYMLELFWCSMTD
jgi:hypothetical protein